MGAPGTTPGPWYVVETDNAKPRFWIVQDPDTWCDRVAAVPDYSERSRLDAHQIAASGALYDALNGLLVLAEMTTFSDQYPEACERAGAALRLARSETPSDTLGEKADV